MNNCYFSFTVDKYVLYLTSSVKKRGQYINANVPVSRFQVDFKLFEWLLNLIETWTVVFKKRYISIGYEDILRLKLMKKHNNQLSINTTKACIIFVFVR